MKETNLDINAETAAPMTPYFGIKIYERAKLERLQIELPPNT